MGYQLIGLEIFLSSHGLFKKAGQYVVLTLFQSGTFLVELITGVFFGYFFYLSTIDSDFVMLLVRCIFTSIMLAIIVIDYETMFIPDRLSIGGAVTGLILALFFLKLIWILFKILGWIIFPAG